MLLTSDARFQYFQDWAYMFKKIDFLKCSFAVTFRFAVNVQNMKPVQNCTGFIYCTFHGAKLHRFQIFVHFTVLNCIGFIFCTFHGAKLHSFQIVYISLCKIAQVSYFVHFTVQNCTDFIFLYISRCKIAQVSYFVHFRRLYRFKKYAYEVSN